ncbi:MAG: hypothetical protein LUE21_01560 [Oscillospiraceae bacterium]|nr:hypothetical protein [Oscillospiraceae bacterium]
MAPTISDDDEVVRYAKMAVDAELRKKKALNQAIATYDPKTKAVRLEKPDGTVIRVAPRITRGRYSERCKKET